MGAVTAFTAGAGPVAATAELAGQIDIAGGIHGDVLGPQQRSGRSLHAKRSYSTTIG